MTLRQTDGQRWAWRKDKFNHILLDLTGEGVDTATLCVQVKAPLVRVMTLQLPDKGVHASFLKERRKLYNSEISRKKALRS